jgi:hypothetical protein
MAGQLGMDQTPRHTTLIHAPFLAKIADIQRNVQIAGYCVCSSRGSPADQ